MINQEGNKKINFTFNLGMIIYLFSAIAITMFFKPYEKTKVPFDYLLNFSPIFAIVLALVIIILAIYFGTLILKSFWNILITDIFKVREITFQEALSIGLILALFL